MSRVILGIDPGLSGALAWMDAASMDVLAVHDLPIAIEGKRKSIDAIAFNRLIATMPPPCMAIIEQVSARPTDSKPSAFTFGRNLGALEALITAKAVPLARVAPVTWRKWVGLPAGIGKDASLPAALRLCPTARPHLEGKGARHDRADAVLIAAWGARYG